MLGVAVGAKREITSGTISAVIILFVLPFIFVSFIFLWFLSTFVLDIILHMVQLARFSSAHLPFL